MSDRLERLLDSRPWLLADGAIGSNLFLRGLVSGEAPDLWNLEHPNRIATLHGEFIDAGSDIILTNTFGGTRHRLKLHKSEQRVAEINEQGARIARSAVDSSGRHVVVAGSMGPTGEILEPIGPLSIAEAADAYAEQARGLATGGVDVLWIETLSSAEELEAAVTGARTTGLPVVATLSFDTNGRTMMGLAPAELASLGQHHQLQAYGSNCGVGPSELVACILNLSSASAAGMVLVAKANCGIPRYADGAIRFDGTPELMAAYACLARDAGARIIGGCCGTTPEHVRAMHTALTTQAHGARPDLTVIEARLGGISTGAQAQLQGRLDRLAGAAPGANVHRGSGRRGAKVRAAE